MKLQITKVMSLLFLLAFFTLASSCSVIVARPSRPRHKQRIIWVSGVSYKQVYYVQDNQIYIVSQVEANPKYKQNKGKKKGH